MKGNMNIEDTIFATIRKAGNTLGRHTLSGFDSVGAVLRELCGMHSGVRGLVTIELRNGTLGWSEQLNLRL
ncbi:MAG: hypothetical protein HDS75_02290 [Bacteroidales bacterium]|nr:hypothetical protein [Bacteroidales bacterium]MDE6802069.1 hypothetical protein [Muribaculaceae bacterium]